MKYSLILLVMTSLIIISVTGKIPDYIKICKRNDPEITKCVLNSILNLRTKLIEGIPELAVPSIDPLHFQNDLDINLGSGFKAVARDLKLTGGKNFTIHDLVVDVSANTYTFSVLVPEIIATGIYEIDAKLGTILVKGNGPINFVARSLTGRGTMYGKNIVRGKNTFNWFPKMNMKLDFTDYEIKLDNLFDGDMVIGEAVNKLLNQEKAEVLASLLPGLEKALVEHILLVANNICKNFTWDELFPVS